MSIIETGAKAMRSVVWTEDDWDTIGNTSRDLYRNEFRAALRSVKPEDVSDAMLDAFQERYQEGRAAALGFHRDNLTNEEARNITRRAIAAAIAKGGE